MKKITIIGVAVVFALSLVSWSVAQEKPKKEEPAPEKAAEAVKPEGAKPEAAQEKPKAEEKKPVAEKPRIWRAGGMVTAVDMKGMTLSIHQGTVKHDRVLKLKVSKKAAQALAGIKAGDLVNVWLSGTMVTSLEKIS